MTETAASPSASAGATTWRALFAEDGGDPLEACKDAPPLTQAIAEAAQKFPSTCWKDVESGCRDEVGKLLDLSVSGCCSTAG
jgi:hypothetical protein